MKWHVSVIHKNTGLQFKPFCWLQHRCVKTRIVLPWTSTEPSLTWLWTSDWTLNSTLFLKTWQLEISVVKELAISNNPTPRKTYTKEMSHKGHQFGSALFCWNKCFFVVPADVITQIVPAYSHTYLWVLSFLYIHIYI